MLKLSSRQALKPLRNHFHSPLPHPLRIPLRTRHFRAEPAAPFQGPPSYATLAQRFSASSPGPINFFRQKAAKEAIERGQFVDTHDISDVYLKDYDALITEIDTNTLHSAISKIANIPYLSEVEKDEANREAKEIHGFFYGETNRMIFPCTISAKDKARWVFFIMHTGAPWTYISAEVAQALGLLEDPDSPTIWDANIAGYNHQVRLSQPDSHISEINLLGIDFCKMKEVHPRYSSRHQRIKYQIGEGWDDPKPKL